MSSKLDKERITKSNSKEKANLTTSSKLNKTTNSKSSEKAKTVQDFKKAKENKNKNKKELETIQEKNPEKNKKTLPLKLNIDYIFRREHYKIKNQKLNFTFGEMKKIISNELKINETDLQIFYLEKELTNKKTKINDLIKDNKIKFFEVKKIIQKSEEINESYSNIVIINNISNGLDLNKQIETFFNDMLIEKNYICEPKSLTSYQVSFLYNDLAFDFKKYLNILKKSNPLYSKITTEIIIPKQNKIDPLITDPNEKKNNKNSKARNNNNLSVEDFKKKLGNFITYNDIKRMERMEDKMKWINQKGFISSGGNKK